MRAGAAAGLALMGLDETQDDVRNVAEGPRLAPKGFVIPSGARAPSGGMYVM
jgi:hypothetical protein